MRRLCIYMTYNRENKIDAYIGKVLEALKSCCSTIVLVCNYEKAKSGLEYVQPYVDDIFYRENRGYDSGAFKDVLCEFLGWDKVISYDELVLANDSFYGFFYPIADTFEFMKQEACDFWGLTGQEAGEYHQPLCMFDAHIHSYFMVFKRQVVNSLVFKDFWERLEYPQNFREAIVKYELAINHLMRQCNFDGRSYIDVYSIRLERNENPCYSRLYELITDYHFPIMKRKCVLIRTIGFASTLKILRFLDKEKRYPVRWILPALENQFYLPEMGESICNSLALFYNKYSNIYIYGAGVCGKNLAVYFEYKGWIYKGFITTDSTGEEVNTIRIDNINNIEINEDTGIIISLLNEQTAEEITKHIGGRCRKEQLFYISKCRALKLPV